MKNPSTISSGESDERAAFEQHIQVTEQRKPLLWSTAFANSLSNQQMPEHFVGKYFTNADQKAWCAWQAREALANQPAESKACASVGVEPTVWQIDDEHGGIAWQTSAPTEAHAASIARRNGKVTPLAPVAALASPAPSVGEPVAAAHRLIEQYKGVTVSDHAYHDDIMAVCRAVLATPPAAPAATEAPSKPFAYYIHIAAEQRGEFVHDLDEALDDLTNCECKITELFDHATPAPAVGASPAQHAPRAITASIMRDDGGEQPAFCLMAAFRTEHEAMTALAAVGASVQPAQASLSDEQIEAAFQKCGGKWDGDRWVIEDADLHPFARTFLASSTPTKGGEAS